MDDLISRQAAIEALKNRWKKTRNYEGTGDDIAEECELYLKQLPSAQPEPRWIPIEYRPPEFRKEVLISYKCTVSIDWLTQSEGSAYFFMSGAGIADIDAWMPLPKPYERSKV